MKLWRRLFFEWMYFRSPPWDSGIVPPEVVEFVSQHSPGRAIDLGCGTGTNAIYLAKNGWQVVGVDFSRKALWVAKRKSREQGVSVKFVHDDVSKLKKVHGTFDFVLDIGCFHGLSSMQKAGYRQRLDQLLVSNGHYLLYGFVQNPNGRPSIQPEDIHLFQIFMELLNQKMGDDKGRLAVWYLFRKVSSPSSN